MKSIFKGLLILACLFASSAGYSRGIIQECASDYKLICSGRPTPIKVYLCLTGQASRLSLSCWSAMNKLDAFTANPKEFLANIAQSELNQAGKVLGQKARKELDSKLKPARDKIAQVNRKAKKAASQVSKGLDVANSLLGH